MRQVYFLILILALSAHAQAALIAYDGFAAGGTAPVPSGTYVSSPNSTNGTDNNSIINQGPALTNFTGNWTGGTWSANVYPRMESTGLTYPGMTVTAGLVDIQRSGGTASTSTKTFSRNASTTDLSSVQWISFLLNENIDNSADTFVQLTFNTAASQPLRIGTAKATSHTAFFSTNAGGTDGAGAISLNNSNTHLFLVKLEAGVVSGQPLFDQITLWVDPDLSLGEAGLGTGIVGNGAVRSDGSGIHSFKALALSGAVNQPGHFIKIDEFHLGTGFADVISVPEPGVIALLSFLAIPLCRRRR